MVDRISGNGIQCMYIDGLMTQLKVSLSLFLLPCLSFSSEIINLFSSSAVQFTDDPTLAVCSDSGGSVFELEMK